MAWINTQPLVGGRELYERGGQLAVFYKPEVGSTGYIWSAISG